MHYTRLAILLLLLTVGCRSKHCWTLNTALAPSDVLHVEHCDSL